jgi:hypothetical protein
MGIRDLHAIQPGERQESGGEGVIEKLPAQCLVQQGEAVGDLRVILQT